MNKILKLSKLENETLQSIGDLVEIGSLTAAKIRVKSKSSRNNPINRMYELFTKLIQDQGVKVVVGNDKISISDVFVTAKTEELVRTECKTYLKARGYKGKSLESQLSWVVMETPATLALKGDKEGLKIEKLAGLKDNKVYVRVQALKEAKKVNKVKND